MKIFSNIKRQKEEKEHNIKYKIGEFFAELAIVITITLFVLFFVILNARIPSESMENGILVGDLIIGNRLAYTMSEPERYDIVMFKYPDDESEIYIKRIIGLPGEKITIKNGKVYVNDGTTPLDDSYIKEPMDTTEYLEFEVPENSYFMLGDNRNESNDSRYWQNHYVKKDKVLAKASFRYFPFNRIGFVE